MADLQSTGVRSANECRVIAAIRAAGRLSRAQIARATGLSAPAASEIVRRLAARGLLQAEAKVRGNVGQPHTPLALDPGGAFSIGIKIGRRGVEGVLLDFTGKVAAEHSRELAGPYPGPTLDAARAMIDGLRAVRPEVKARLVGLGVATPWDLHAWTDALDLPMGALDGWKGLDIATELRTQDMPSPLVINDASAALAAQMARGPDLGRCSALYLYLGTFIGGGLSIDGALRLGDHGNAGAMASAFGLRRDAAGRPMQLLHEASLAGLERAMHADGLPAAALIRGFETSPQAERHLAAWLDAAAPAMAHAIVAAQAVCDISHVVIDGIMGAPWRARIVAAVSGALDACNLTGLHRPSILQGDLGWSARVLGAAMIPMQRAFAPPDAFEA